MLLERSFVLLLFAFILVLIHGQLIKINSTNLDNYQQEEQQDDGSSTEGQTNEDQSTNNDQTDPNEDQQTQLPQAPSQNNQQQQQVVNETQEPQTQEGQQSEDQPPQAPQGLFGLIRRGFEEFINLFRPNYSEQEKPYGKEIYQQNVKQIQQHNSESDKSYQRGVNSFADLSDQQFKGLYLMQQPGQVPIIKIPALKIPPFYIMIPSNWKNKMGQAKHQMKCGACWAFSVVQVIQQKVKVEKNLKRQFSAQHLIDCVKKGANGCRGGWPVSAMQFIAQNGLASQQDYPYVAVREKCRDVETQWFLDAENPFTRVKGVLELSFALTYGPVSVIVDASTWDPLYKFGLFNKCPDKKFNYNHAVTVVAVGLFGHWTIRNSWGKLWGEKGHIRLPPGNSCGIADMGILPVLS